MPNKNLAMNITKTILPRLYTCIYMRIRELVYRISRSTAFIVVAVSALGLLTTLWAWTSARQTSEKNLRDYTMQRVQTIEKFIDEKLISFEGILQGSAGLFDASGSTVTREQWRLFAVAQRFKEEFPAVESLGYVENFASNNVDEHQSRIREQGLADYTVKSDIKIDEYSVVVYVEPQTESSPIGYNMLSEPLRAQALRQASTTGETALSSILNLKNKPDKAFLVVYPLYARPELPASLKKNNNVGYAYLAINVKKLFELEQAKSIQQKLEFAVSEGEDFNNVDYIYKSTGFEQRSAQEIIHQPISVNDKKWVIHTVVNKSSAQYKTSRSQPLIAALIGILSTIIVSISIGQILKTKSRQVERTKELELQKSRDELLSLASHQLRTPATTVKHYVGMLLEGYGGNIDKKQREFLNRAYVSNERQLDIINQILHISRIESGSLELERRPVNINKLVKDVLIEQKKILKDKQQKVKKEIEKTLPLINADPVYLGIVIENLITNASKYTLQKGSISITVYSDAHKLTLEVSDTGVGIDKHDIDKLFKKFSRIHNELSISSGGSGIGLYLSKLIVELHGGSIEIISRKGVGSTFRIKLPLELSE